MVSFKHAWEKSKGVSDLEDSYVR